MRKIMILLISSILFISSNLKILAKEINFKIIEAQTNIRNAATIDVIYKPNIVINAEILDPLVREALNAKEAYEDSEETLYKDLETNIMINLKGTYKKFDIELSNNIKDYSDFIDYIIINANDIYCFIKPSDVTLDKSGENIILSVKDINNVVSRYNGTSKTRTLKIVLIFLFLFVIIYLVIFNNLIVKKKDLKGNINKKTIYLFSIIIMFISAMLALVTIFTDWSRFAQKKQLSLKDNDIPYFDITFSKNLSSKQVTGFSLGVPVFSDNINSYLAAAVKKNTDNTKGDTVFDCKYIESMALLKFAIKESGLYYIKNNGITFNDINSNDEDLYEAVSILGSKNILSGKSDNIFGAEDFMLRSEVVTMFCKVLDFSNSSDSVEDFIDVKNDDWYYNYAMIAREKNILSGYDDNSFRGSNTITRQEFATLLGQTMVERMGYNLPQDTSNLQKYDDYNDIAPWAANYIALLERENINIWDTTYLPTQPITRGDASVLLYRCYILMK